MPVGRLVGWSVGLSGNAFVRRSTRRPLLAYLALFTAPAHPDATWVAVYPALFFGHASRSVYRQAIYLAYVLAN